MPDPLTALADADSGAERRRIRDVVLSLGVVLILVTLIIPLPAFFLDLLLALNISSAIVILLVSLNMREALELSTFPSILLFSALFRLSLNVASTRLILLRGDAGETIRAFGNFVVGGEVAVGIVIFLILVVIQFVVITKGAGRISEVAARFTLDAMPGKQMAIDADLNSGLITEEEARERRKRITEEADFYSAMDGASKFVRGDAVAGLIITAINIVGGLAIGLQQGLTVAEALPKYTILTIGDGLVSQIPALILSTSGGIIVTKASTDTHLADELFGQFQRKAQALGGGALLLASLALVPGLPTLPFLILSGVLGGLYLSSRRANEAEEEAEKERAEAEEDDQAVDPGEIDEILSVDRISVEVGYRLIPLVQEQDQGLISQITGIRREFARSLGIVVPPVRVKDNIQLEASTYRILLADHEIARGSLVVDHFLALDPGIAEGPIPGRETVDPVFGLPAKWVTAAHRAEAEFLNYTVIDAPSVLITHLKEVLRQTAHELLSLDDVQALNDALKGRAPTTVEEATKHISLTEIHQVLRNLLREGVSIRGLQSIYEALAQGGAKEQRDVESLTETVRTAIARSIWEPLLDRDGHLPVLTFEPQLESRLIESTVGPAPQPMPAESLQRLANEIQTQGADQVSRGIDPVVVVRPAIRRFLCEILLGQIPRLPVLSYSEISQVRRIESVGIIRLSAVTGEQVMAGQAAGLQRPTP
ncbi:MAG: flagellar biosynthesis protein FlhA [Planctomycetota bacterium]